MMTNTKRLFLLFGITTVVTFSIFYLFSEEKECVTDFGSKCSNSFLLRSLVQTIFMTGIFYFFGNKKEKKDS